MGVKWSLDRRKYLDRREVKSLIKVLRGMTSREIGNRDLIAARDSFMTLLGLHSGLRVGELAVLRNRDFMLYDNYAFIHVRHGKGKKERLVRVGEELVRAYREFCEYKKGFGLKVDDDSIVLCKVNSEKLSVRALQLAFKKIAHLAKLDPHYSIHCLRHTYGTNLYQASGNNIRLVQKQLGHSSISVTEVYADVVEEDATKAIKGLYKNC